MEEDGTRVGSEELVIVAFDVCLMYSKSMWKIMITNYFSKLFAKENPGFFESLSIPML